ncbi:MAG: arylsulfatase [Chitinophagaceae bacterium]|nr:arylsulfatase [Chitinophagaceae bacterium]
MIKKTILIWLQLCTVWIYAQQKPNVVFIYADDLGYGDLSCYGASAIQTPNIDRLASQGLLLTNAHATSATCTPSRFSLMTGTYAWRKTGTGIAPGNASLIIPQEKINVASVFKSAGYTSAVVGKWHLGLGAAGGPNWNGEIKPGPLELGFDYSFIIPATVDRVPCIYVENHRVYNYNAADPIEVNYSNPVGNNPTGKSNPGLLKVKPSHGHDQTIVNGISRIGYMSGGKDALWKDEEIADVLVQKARTFITDNKNNRFFLFLNTHDVHVPRTPHERFAGKSSMGLRGDVILQLDATVGAVMKILDSLRLSENTMVIFSSDNGPVVDDGYQEQAVERLNGHTPGGLLRGGKYSAFEAGTRVPFIVRWPGVIQPGITSDALFSQVDMLASFAKLTGQQLPENEATDSFDQLAVLTGQSKQNRIYIIEHAGVLSVVKDHWKYIEPGAGPAKNNDVNIELGNALQPQLYNLSADIGERNNVAGKHPAVLKELQALLEKIRNSHNERKNYSAPALRQ